ncbi:MAG: type I-C CRISPR-associated protein Cas8c/Csd1 [Planctomycetota bacterium]|nr:MAG: type I-C CRISPR-associated protein Cas8c/Csd1 [Planctomycetota bacterium]REK28444.1 MAG: type I-C CRISPR-associated protein Cas8c/Csd1 [Planctomycetota bacterium]REK29138.1 MAG: type I-C CRISPR-associated protein Cas8c/Csd1 [Planctomycetota bacterium]
MILQALCAYYDRLKDDPQTGIAEFGYSVQKISFEVVLNDDGSLHAIEDARQQDGKNLISQSLIMPGGAKPSGSGINPCFLWDNTGYMLGFKPDDTKPERTAQTFEAFREKHLALQDSIDDPEFVAVCRFLTDWNPAEAPSHDVLNEIGGGFGVFRIRGQKHRVHERDAVQNWWREQLAAQGAEDAALGQCLITGETGPLARLHEPKVKGVRGAQSSGAALVSFNFDAATSYGKEQSVNSPVSQQAAFQYCTALNMLLQSGSQQRIQIGDGTTVFWTEQPTAAESFMGMVLGGPATEDEALLSQLNALLKAIAAGNRPPELGDPDTRFFILGLSPNAARISIRFWHVSTLGQMVEHLRMHFSDLAIVRSRDRDPEFPYIWQLLRETARESKDVPPQLSGVLMRAIVTGTLYPDALASAVIRRIRADREMNYLRAAILKAWLTRHSRFDSHPLDKEIATMLDVERSEPAYHMGRLFAALEKAQEDALKGINATIKDRYFGAASATPGSVFPRLIRLSQHHLAKLETGAKIHRERNIQEICGRINEFPSHLNLRDQGLFAIGYYHQRQDFFTKKLAPESPSDEE